MENHVPLKKIREYIYMCGNSLGLQLKEPKNSKSRTRRLGKIWVRVTVKSWTYHEFLI